MKKPTDADATLAEILEFMIATDKNVSTFVRKPKESVAPGIMIITIEQAAYRLVGPIVVNTIRGIKNNPPQTVLDIAHTDPVRLVFEWMDAEQMQWAAQTMPFISGEKLHAISFVGPLCRKLAKQLNKAGIPTAFN